jgi:hypothetical protein
MTEILRARRTSFRLREIFEPFLLLSALYQVNPQKVQERGNAMAFRMLQLELTNLVSLRIKAIVRPGLLMGRIFCGVFSVLSITGISHAGSPAAASTRMQADYGKVPLSFEANRGQTDPRVQFFSRGNGYGLFLTPGEAVLELQKGRPAVHK